MTTYVETDCTITHHGHDYTAGGTVVCPDWVIGYVGNDLKHITDWHGRTLGSARVTASWATPYLFSDRMYQIEATIDGIRYTGRSQGAGMIWRGFPKRTRR